MVFHAPSIPISYDAAGDMTCHAPTYSGSSPTGALLTAWQNAPSSPTSPTSQAWLRYDGEGHRVEQYTSGGSGSHTYYLPGNVEEVTPSTTLVKYYSAGGLALGVNTTSTASGISYLASDGLGSVTEALRHDSERGCASWRTYRTSASGAESGR